MELSKYSWIMQWLNLFVGSREQVEQEIGQRHRVDEPLDPLDGSALCHDVEFSWWTITCPTLQVDRGNNWNDETCFAYLNCLFAYLHGLFKTQCVPRDWMSKKSIPENTGGHLCTYMMWYKYTSKTHVVKQERRKFSFVTSFTRCSASTCRSWKSEVRSLMAWLARITDKTPKPWWLKKKCKTKRNYSFFKQDIFS